LVAILPHVQSGKIRALAVSSARRSSLLPDVPTLAEDAVPGFEASGWQGWFVAAKTPPEVVAKIHREAAKIIGDPAIAKRLHAMGNEPVGSTPEAFDKKFRADVARFAKLIKDAGIPQQ
jgi:tripartite-type tricarboxylate transporter receptor subunit TctC